MTDSLAQTMAPVVLTEDGERPLTADEQRQYERDADTWWTANSLPVLGQLTADWLEGRSLFLPAYCATGPDPETTDLIPTLAALNRAGLVTDSSQPGHGPVEGYDGRMWLQRAYVSGYTDAGTIHSLAATLAHHDDLILWCRPVKHGARKPAPDRDYFPATIRENDDTAETGEYDVNTVAGLTPTRRDVKDLYRGELNPAAIKTLQRAWHVTVADTEYRTDGRLWAFLAEWAKRRTI